MCSTKHLGDLVLGFGRQKARRRKRKRHSKPLTCPGIWVFWAGVPNHQASPGKSPYDLIDWYFESLIVTIWLLHSAYDFQLPTNTGVFAESSSIIRGSWVISLFILYKQRWCFCTQDVLLKSSQDLRKIWRLTNMTFFTNNRLKQENTEMVCLFQGCRVCWVSGKIYDYMILCVDFVVWQRWLKKNLALRECLVIGADFELQVQLWFQYLTKTTQASPWRMLISLVHRTVLKSTPLKGLWQDFRIKDEMRWDPRPWIQWAMARRMISTMRRASTPTPFWRFDVFFAVLSFCWSDRALDSIPCNIMLLILIIMIYILLYYMSIYIYILLVTSYQHKRRRQHIWQLPNKPFEACGKKTPGH